MRDECFKYSPPSRRSPRSATVEPLSHASLNEAGWAAPGGSPTISLRSRGRGADQNPTVVFRDRPGQIDSPGRLCSIRQTDSALVRLVADLDRYSVERRSAALRTLAPLERYLADTLEPTLWMAASIVWAADRTPPEIGRLICAGLGTLVRIRFALSAAGVVEGWTVSRVVAGVVRGPSAGLLPGRW